ncbi:MAG: protein kinase [Verrucomicrobia bacterium]|nr:protein kinase [Verrucomicrobiota bacterium]
MNPPSDTGQRVQLEEFQRQHRTGLVTLLFTDIVESTALKQRLGDRAGAAFFEKHHQLVRATRARFTDAREIETAGDSFLIVFAKPSDAAQFALLVQARLRDLSRESGVTVQDRIGIHVGEVVIKEGQTSARPTDLYGIQIDICARVMSLARAGQVLMTRSVFDSARQVLKGEDIEGIGALEWLNHGLYLLKGLDEPVEICEVREVGQDTGGAPAGTEKAQRQVASGDEQVLGWRPALGQRVPNTEWVLERKLGEGGFGEVWLGRHQTMKERRVFKFCFRADRVRFLKREMTLFRLLKERVGDHPNIVRLLEVYFNEPPFYVEMDYVEGSDLRTWSEERGGVASVPLETRLEIVAQAAEGLQAAHDAGVIHRDIKPTNILVESSSRGHKAHARSDANVQRSTLNVQHSTESPTLHASRSTLGQTSELPDVGGYDIQAKLTDFGIGQVVSQEALAGITRAGFTQTMMSDSSSSHTGTQLYMAPELLAGKPASIRSDIYSLGVVLWQLLVGDLTRPLTTDWADEVADPLLRDDLKHCFAGNPQDRFAGAGQLAQQLRALFDRREVLERQQEEQAALERAAYRRGMIRTALAAILIILSVSGLALFAFKQANRASASAQAEAREKALAQRRLYASDMNLTFKALEENQVGHARELLDRHRSSDPDLRDWAWRFLWGQTRGDEARTLEGHSDIVETIRFSQDGQLLISGDHEGKLIIRKAPTFEIFRQMRHDGEPGAPRGVLLIQSAGDQINSVDISPNNRFVAIGGGGSAEVWDIHNERTVDRVTAGVFQRWRTAGAGCVRFTPKGELLLIGDARGELHFRDFQTHTNLASRKLHAKGISAFAFSPNGRRLASSGSHDELLLWEVSGTTNLSNSARLDARGAGAIFELAFSPSGDWLVGAGVSLSESSFLRVWNVSSGQMAKDLVGHTRWVGGAAFSHDGERLFTASADQSVKIWDVKTWSSKAQFNGHLNEIWCLASSSDGRTIATGGKDNLVKLWDLTAPVKAKGPLRLQENVRSLGRSSDHTLFMARDGAGAMHYWEANSLRRLNADGWPQGLTSFNQKAELGSLVEDHTVTLLNLKTGRKHATVKGDLAFFSADGNTLLVRDTPQSLTIYQLPDCRILATLKEDFVLLPEAFSPSGRYVLVKPIAGSRTCVFWDRTSNRRKRIELGKVTSALADFSGDEKLLALAGSHGVFQLFTLTEEGVVEVFKADPNLLALNKPAFSPDGRTVAVASGGRAVWLVDTLSHQEIGMLKDCGGLDRRAIFSADGNNLLVSDTSGALYAFQAPSLEEIVKREKAGR